LNKKKKTKKLMEILLFSFVYAKMGTFFKKEIFDEHIQQGLVGWAQKAKRRTESIKECAGGGTHGPSSGLEMLRRAAAAIQGSRAPQR
jgi:mlo protein